MAVTRSQRTSNSNSTHLVHCFADVLNIGVVHAPIPGVDCDAPVALPGVVVALVVDDRILVRLEPQHVPVVGVIQKLVLVVAQVRGLVGILASYNHRIMCTAHVLLLVNREPAPACCWLVC